MNHPQNQSARLWTIVPDEYETLGQEPGAFPTRSNISECCVTTALPFGPDMSISFHAKLYLTASLSTV